MPKKTSDFGANKNKASNPVKSTKKKPHSSSNPVAKVQAQSQKIKKKATSPQTLKPEKPKKKLTKTVTPYTYGPFLYCPLPECKLMSYTGEISSKTQKPKGHGKITHILTSGSAQPTVHYQG